MTLVSEVGRNGQEGRAECSFMPLSPEEVGQRIVSAREDMKPKRWSRLDLAIAMGVSPSSIYRWETGRLPSVNELVRLAEVLGKPLDYLTEPPERQTELADLRVDLDRILAFLEQRRDEAERAQEAAFENLASIHDRLSRIEERLAPPVSRSETRRDH